MGSIMISMKWEDVNDPKNEISFHMEWTLVSSQYLPEEIQELIDKEGVQGTVRIVNEHFKLLPVHGRPVMHLTHVAGKKAVTQY